MKRLASAVVVLVVGFTAVACGSATYTDENGQCHNLTVQKTTSPDGIVYNGVADGTCAPTPTVTNTVTQPPVTSTATVTAPPVTSTTTVTQPPVTLTAPPVTVTQTVTQTVTPPATTTATSTSTPPPPPQSGYPTAATTGAPSGVALTQITGNYTAGANEVIDGKRITGTLTIAGNNVTVRNSEVYGVISNGSGHYSFSLTDVTVGAPSGGCNGDAAIRFDNYIAIRVRVRNFGDAFRGTTSSGAASNILIQDSLATLCSNAGDHSDGYQGYQAGSNVRLIHNTIDQRNAPDATAPLFNADASKAVYADNNLLAGGSFTIRVYDDTGQRSTITNNKVVNGSAQYGPVNSSCASITWTGNTLVNIDANYGITSTVGSLACAG